MSSTGRVNLRAERRNRGLSISQMAREIGVPYYVLRDAERGTVPRGRNARIIAEFFDTTVVAQWPEERAA